MNSKRLAVLSALALTLVVGLMIFSSGRTKAAGPSCNVPGDYATIQGAVNDTGCTTINVAAGTYSENLIIPRAVTLSGPNANIDPNTGSRVAEATITNFPGNTAIQPQAPGIVINGFTVSTTAADFPIYTGGTDITGLTISYNIVGSGVRAITVATNGSDLSILNNKISGAGYGINFGGGTYGNVKINNNVVNGPDNFYAIFISGNGTIAGFELKDNKIHDTVNIAANTSNGTVSGNTFDAALGSGLDIQIDLHNSTMTGNTFEGHNTSLAGDNNACLQLFGSQFGLVPSDHVTMSGNTFNNCGAAAPPWTFAIQLSPDIHDINITNNVISNSVDGVNTRDSTPWTVAATIHVNLNNITGSTNFGVRNGQTGVLDATCNWWGASNGPGPVGPGSGDKVSTNVTFQPWLTSSAPGGLCVGPDSDGDGVTDSQDGCPNDPNKIAPGVCGCGHPDVDTDHDGTLDCNDGCPNDPNKTAPGVCGCGVADTDSDHDGTPNCHDACPNDPNKIAPGVCGCGHPETPGCTTTKKDCQKYFEQKEKAFEDQQKADKKAFDSQPHTKQQKKAFEDQQEAAEKAFDKQNEIDEKQCDSLPKGGKDDKDDKDKDEKHDK